MEMMLLTIALVHVSNETFELRIFEVHVQYLSESFKGQLVPALDHVTLLQEKILFELYYVVEKEREK